MKTPSKRLIKTLRWLFTLLFVALLFYLQEKPLSSSKEPIVLYATQDDLRKVYLDAIDQAQESIFLIMYSLSDKRIIEALNRKAQEGIKVTVLHDTTTDQMGFEKLNVTHCQGLDVNGLMHQKILITDGSNAWIGSANFTTESLRLHDNLVASIHSPELCKTLLYNHPIRSFIIGNQLLEIWRIPEEGKEGLQRLLSILEGAQKSLRVAMYTWTHPELTEAILRAQARGVAVEVILDQGQAYGVGKREFKRLINSNIPLWVSSGQKLLHHKCLWVDNEILVNGSANWTKAAFSKNKDCFFILHDLNQEQRSKLEKMWVQLRAQARKNAQKKDHLSKIVLYEDLSLWLWQDGNESSSSSSLTWTCARSVA